MKKIPRGFTPGQWYNGHLYDARIHSGGRDTYPDDFIVYVEIRHEVDGKSTINIQKGKGKYIGNFAPIWVKWGGKDIQLTELLSIEKPLAN